MNKEKKTSEESIVDRLPILDQHEMRTALSEHNIHWARELMASPRGKIHLLNHGVYLQRVSDESVRCVGIVDHRQALDLIASMRATLAEENVDIQFEPYTVLIPFEDVAIESSDSEDAPTGSNHESSGMEFV